MKKTVRKTVSEEYDGIKTGLFVKKEMEVSSTLVKKLKKSDDGILVNKNRVFTDFILHAGDEVEINFEDKKISDGVIPTAGDFDILYEDADLLIIDKKAGVPVHPSKGHADDSLANFVTDYFIKKGEPSVFRCVTRLDKGTSGVCVTAKNSRAHTILSKSGSEKTYVAAAVGIFENKEGIIDADIRRIPNLATIKREVCTSGGKRAVTGYRVIAEENGTSLVELKLFTGRTHQIRVHLSHIGHPLVGDWLYGAESDKISRPALHCRSVTLIHPETKEKMTFVSEIPKDILGILFPYEGGRYGNRDNFGEF